MPDPTLIQYGNQYNVPVHVWYIEDDSEVSNIPDTEPVGTMAEVNKADDFHFLMKNRAGNWNTI